jgi:hypothetical protein
MFSYATVQVPPWKKGWETLLYHLSKTGQTSTKQFHETWRAKKISPVAFRPDFIMP